MSAAEPLTALTAGMAVLFGGDRFTRVDDALAAAFQPGDRLVVVQSSGDLLHVPAADVALVDAAVSAAHRRFGKLAGLADAAITRFYEAFAARIADDAVFARCWKPTPPTWPGPGPGAVPPPGWS